MKPGHLAGRGKGQRSIWYRRVQPLTIHYKFGTTTTGSLREERHRGVQLAERSVAKPVPVGYSLIVLVIRYLEDNSDTRSDCIRMPTCQERVSWELPCNARVNRYWPLVGRRSCLGVQGFSRFQEYLVRSAIKNCGQ